MTSNSYANRVRGCLFGGAVGDAFGYAVEFLRLDSIKEIYGEGGIQKPELNAGMHIVSDDTQMTMFTLEGLLRATRGDPDDIVAQVRLAYLDWYATQSQPIPSWKPAGRLYLQDSLRCRRAPGNTCLSALDQDGYGTLDTRANDSKGCGGVMRVAPIGLLKELSPTQALEIGAQTAAITHGHPSGYWSSGALAAIVRLLFDGIDIASASEQTAHLLSDKPESGEVTRAIDAALAAARNTTQHAESGVSSLGEGWVGEEALAIGIYAALKGKSFQRVLSIGSNHDGDSDSTASIAGQIYGAWKGDSDLPEKWVEKLDVIEPLRNLIEALISREAQT